MELLDDQLDWSSLIFRRRRRHGTVIVMECDDEQTFLRQFGANDWLLQRRSYRRRLNESIVEEEITMHNFPSFSKPPAFRCSSLQSTQCFGSVSVIAKKWNINQTAWVRVVVVNIWHHTNWGWWWWWLMFAAIACALTNHLFMSHLLCVDVVFRSREIYFETRANGNDRWS